MAQSWSCCTVRGYGLALILACGEKGYGQAPIRLCWGKGHGLAAAKLHGGRGLGLVQPGPVVRWGAWPGPDPALCGEGMWSAPQFGPRWWGEGEGEEGVHGLASVQLCRWGGCSSTSQGLGIWQQGRVALLAATVLPLQNFSTHGKPHRQKLRLCRPQLAQGWRLSTPELRGRG